MEHLRKLQSVNAKLIWATIGSFDGIHLGHQYIIRSMVKEAKQNNIATAIFTFYPHPTVVLRDIPLPFYLTSPEEKASLFGQMGIDYVFTLTFDSKLASLSPEQFISSILQNIPVKQFWIGNDFTLGKGRSGTISVLRELGQKYSFEMIEINHLEQSSEKISSSTIRQWVIEGKMVSVNQALGRPYAITGNVIHGDSRGRTIGFPTANLSVWEGKLLPSSGVYATMAKINNKSFPSVTNIGYRPTFENNQTAARVETHIFNFDQNIYNLPIQLDIIEKIRPEKRFSDISALKDQINQDIIKAQEILGHAS